MSRQGTNKWLVLAVVGAAFFMTILDVAIVNVAIPSIQKDLHIAESTVQWVITAYAITFGGFLLLGGRMADLLGRRRIFIVGLVLFTVASLVCGLAIERRRADRVTRRTGGRCGDHLAGRALDRDDDVRARARSGTRRSGSGARSAAPALRSACCSAGS